MKKNVHTITVDQPKNLADHLRSLRMPVKMSCGGHGSCTSCRVILDGEPVLSCQTEVKAGEYSLEVPMTAIESSEIYISLDSFDDASAVKGNRWHSVSVEVPHADSQPNLSNRQRLEGVLEKHSLELSANFWKGLSADQLQGQQDLACFDNRVLYPSLRKAGERYAVAVDIGTTTVACGLIHLNEQKVLSCRGRLNAQYGYAEDLIARIAFCVSPARLEEMRNLILRQTLIPLIWNLLRESEVSSERVITTIISGNAPMIHLLLGYDPTGMGGWPFNGVDYAPGPMLASDLKLPGQRVEFIPAQSAYFGGDVLSGLQWLDFENVPDRSLFIDLGTNAEMALKVGDDLLCTAVPAGPAFEGGGLACGVGAVPGAVDRVWEVGDRLEFSTIGDQPPIGFCGSGVVSFVAAAFRAGILKKKGRFNRNHPLVQRTEILGKCQRIYCLAEEVYLSEEDISAFLQAKAAVFSGAATLCQAAGVDVFGVTKLLLAGNFGRSVPARDLVDIGMIPPLGADSINVCGNASLKGAINVCVDPDATVRLERLIARLQFVDLNAQATFQNDFINALFLPHLKHDFSRTPVSLNL